MSDGLSAESIDTGYIKATEGELDQLVGMIYPKGRISTDMLVLDTDGGNRLVIQAESLGDIRVTNKP